MIPQHHSSSFSSHVTTTYTQPLRHEDDGKPSTTAPWSFPLTLPANVGDDKPTIIRLARRFPWRYVMRLLRDAFWLVLLLMVAFRTWDALKHDPYMELHAQDVTRMEDGGGMTDYLYSVFMVSKNRYDYRQTMEPWIEMMKHDSVDGSVPREFVLFDVESDVPLKIDDTLWQRREELWRRHRIDLKIVRKEPLPDMSYSQEEAGQWTEEEKRTRWKKTFRFSSFAAWMFAMQNIAGSKHYDGDQRVFYFDNCNLPNDVLRFEDYLEKGASYYFPNVDRYYTGNFATDKSLFVRYLSEIPSAFAYNPNSFQGADQMSIWYLNSKRVLPKVEHLPHEAIAFTGSKRDPESIYMIRMWLYMNRYSNPVHGGHYNEMGDDFCRDKSLLCFSNGVLPRLLALPGIYDLLDTVLRLEILFYPAFVVVNLLGPFWITGFTVSGVISIFALGMSWRAIHFAVMFVVNRLRYSEVPSVPVQQEEKESNENHIILDMNQMGTDYASHPSHSQTVKRTAK